jgi:hypothetical protein
MFPFVPLPGQLRRQKTHKTSDPSYSSAGHSGGLMPQSNRLGQMRLVGAIAPKCTGCERVLIVMTHSRKMFD